jgi:putative flippase GtrA
VRAHAFRALRFGLVGVVATATHMVVSISLLKLAEFSPVLANMTAFCVAFSVSLIGHTLFTFRSRLSLAIGVRFSVVALLSLMVSTLTVWMMSRVPFVSPTIATLSGAFCAPVVSYLFNSLWTYRRREAGPQ